MEAPAAVSNESPKPRRIPSWAMLAILIAAALALRLGVIARTHVAARDSIGFTRAALRLERDPVVETLRSCEHPPGYPAVVMLVSWPVRAWRGDTSVETMILSCQLASALMAVLAIFPTVMLGRELGGRSVGWVAAALFLCMPVWLKMTSDGLSEGTYLFWLATSCWLGVRALRKPSVLAFLLFGLSAGATYLTRPEGLELAVAMVAAILLIQVISAKRQSWTRVAGQVAAVGCGVLVFLGPYVAMTGRLTNKNTGRIMLGAEDVDRTGLTPGTQSNSGTGRLPLAVWWYEPTHAGQSRSIWAVKALGTEILHGFQVAGLALALVGLFLMPKRSALGLGLIGLLVSLHAFILWRMAIAIGYLSERHTLLFVFAGSFPAAVAILWIGNRMAGWLDARGWRGRRIMTSLLIVGLLGMSSYALAKPLHGNRAGHKAAGLWLAKNITDDDAILDPFSWGEFYAGRIDQRNSTQRPQRLFVILERSNNQHSRLPQIPAAKANAALGTLVYHWPENRPESEAVVVVYSVPGERLPDPATLKPSPVYRLGVKAAKSSPASPATARDG